jgi:hypothetical protein
MDVRRISVGSETILFILSLIVTTTTSLVSLYVSLFDACLSFICAAARATGGSLRIPCNDATSWLVSRARVTQAKRERSLTPMKVIGHDTRAGFDIDIATLILLKPKALKFN